MHCAACWFRRVPVAARVVLLVALWGTSTLVAPAYAQFAGAWSAEQLTVGAQANLFASWAGNEGLHGVIVELPAGWRLERAIVLRYGYEPAAVQVRRSGDRRYYVEAGRLLQGPHDLVLQVQTGSLPGAFEWSVTPFVRQSSGRQSYLMSHDGMRLTRPLRLVFAEPLPVHDNRVLGFGEAAREPLLLRAAALPELGLRSAHTVAFWMKAGQLGEVVLSTWSGSEAESYPMEFVVSEGGRLLYYRGRPGQHESMTSHQPVADGRWHHIALTHDPAAGWTRLYLDGRTVDSLYSAVPLPVRPSASLAIGGRVPARAAASGGLAPYTGLIDELTFWEGVRPARLIRSNMRQPLRSAAAADRQVVHLGFEEALPAALLAQRPRQLQRIPSDLSFYRPIRDLRAAIDDGNSAVRIEWEAADDLVTRFVVERSADGRLFEEVGRVPAVGTATHYQFRDVSLPDQVVFYRVRQVFAGGAERTSGTIKIGVGRAEQPVAALVGNFPNPFNNHTTVTYEVYRPHRVRVSVWDLAGQQIALLVDEEQAPGYYETPFQAGDLPSGTYFVRLQTVSGISSHKMILMK